MSSKNSDGSLDVSQTPGSCKKGQTPTDQPMFTHDKSVAGLNMKLTPRSKYTVKYILELHIYT